jgi:glycerophosphoryl diester phosphodiesterase
MSRPNTYLADLTALDRHTLVALERDNEQGATAAWKKVFVVEAPGRRAGVLRKREVVDLLAVRDPALISLPGRPGDLGLGDPFAFPYQTVESVLPVGGRELAFVNDTNFGSTGRNPALPDYSDFVVVRVPGLRGR